MYLSKAKEEMFFAPFDVRLPNSKKSNADKTILSVVQPDISIICDPNKIDERGCIGATDLIVEIVSKGNTKKELETKFDLYQENGVQEYWIVFQNDEIVQVFDLVKGKYKHRKTYSNDSIVPVGIFKGFSIDLKEIFYCSISCASLSFLLHHNFFIHHYITSFYFYHIHTCFVVY